MTPPSNTRDWQRNAVLLLRGCSSFSFGKMRLTLLAILGLGGDFSGESKQKVKEADFVYSTFILLIPSPASIPISQAIARCTHAHVQSPKKTTHSPGGLRAQDLSLFPAGCSCFLQLLRIPTHGTPLLVSSHLLRLKPRPLSWEIEASLCLE